MLDPLPTDLSAESSAELDARRYKTTARGMYDAASARGGAGAGAVEVLLHSTDGAVLETCTSNVALWLPRTRARGRGRAFGGGVAGVREEERARGADVRDGEDEGEWVTPRLSPASRPDGGSASAGGAHQGDPGDPQALAVFLDGVVRQELIARGVMREGEVSVGDWEMCRREGRPVVGFNGLR
jgi:hypothetical protein